MANLDPLALDQLLVAALHQQTGFMRQNVQSADAKSIDVLNQVIGYFIGVSSFISTYEGIAQQLRSLGLFTFSNRVAALRSEVTAQMEQYRLTLAGVRATPQPAPGPLDTPEGLRDFQQRIQDGWSSYKQEEEKSEEARKSILDN